MSQQYLGTDPLYACRRTLQTGSDLLTDKQKARLATVFAVDAHAQVEATWIMYQRTVAAYRHRDRATGRTMMPALITTMSTGVPQALQVTSTGPAHPTDRPKRSPAASNTSQD